MKARFIVTEVRNFADKAPMMILGSYYPDVSLDGSESEELVDVLVDIANGDVPEDFMPEGDTIPLVVTEGEPFPPGTVVDIEISEAASR